MLPSIIETPSSEDMNHRTTQFVMMISMPIFFEDDGWGRKENGDHFALLFSHTFARTLCIYLGKHSGSIAHTLFLSHFLCYFFVNLSFQCRYPVKVQTSSTIINSEEYVK